MRYLLAIIVAAFMLSSGVVMGQGEQEQGTEIVVDANDVSSDDKEFGAGNEREMPQYETYDENTGLPNVVPSDENGEIGN